MDLSLSLFYPHQPSTLEAYNDSKGPHEQEGKYNI